MAGKNIAIVTPSHRQELTDSFLKAWQPLFDKHDVEFVLIDDSGEVPFIVHNGVPNTFPTNELISNHCAGVKQFGFQYVAEKLPDVEYIIALDTDCFPIGDPIQDHIDALNMRVPISWFSTATDYMRGFPYAVRSEAPVMLSHGVWTGVYDWDAPSQLLKADKEVDFPKMPIPKGIYYPMCGMNLAFRRKAIPYIYFAPVGDFKGAERFDDIYAGIALVKDFADLNWAMVTGYSKINHIRASNVFYSLEKEAVGIRHNEEFWKDPLNYKGDKWFDDFREKRKRWFELTNK